MAQQIAIGVLKFFAWLYLVGAIFVSMLLLFGVFVSTGLNALAPQGSSSGLVALLAALPAIGVILGGGFAWAFLLVIASAAEDLMFMRRNTAHPTHFTR